MPIFLCPRTPLYPHTSSDLLYTGEFLGQAARDQVLQRASWFIGESSLVPASTVVGHCKQITKFTLPDCEVFERRKQLYAEE